MALVLMRRSGNLVEAIPQEGITLQNLHGLLRERLRYGKRIRNDRRTAGFTGHKFRTEPRYLCRLQQNAQQGSVIFCAGLLCRATALCEQCHIDWQLQDLRPQLLPSPEIERMELTKIAQRKGQMECLATIFSSDMGVIDSATGWGKTFLIGQLCRAWPAARIIICTYRRDTVNSIHERLRDERHVSPGELGIIGGGKRRLGRVTVSTVDSLEHAEPDKCRLFLYDEVHEAAAEDRQRKIGTIRLARMFGFSASPGGRTDGSDLAVEAMFGPVIYRLPYQDAAAVGDVATITVDIHRVPGAPIPYDDDVQQFRHGIWRNVARNQLIAKVAAEEAMKDKQVLVIVDKVEHALSIKSRFLPHWPIVHGPVHAEQVRHFRGLGLLPQGAGWLCTSEQRESYRKRFEHSSLKYAIATGVWSQGVDFKHLDVLVRCDGQSSSIKSTQLPGRLARGEAGLLKDFDDVFDERFARRSKTRFRHYEEKGWALNYC